MKHLRKFETTAAFDAAKPTLETPWVALTEDDEKVHFMESGEPTPSIPNNEFWYTTVDGQPLEIKPYAPYPVPFDGYTIQSNTYTDGKGIIVLDRDLTEIGRGAFNNNPQIQSCTLPNSVTSIGSWVWTNSSLDSIIIPNSVTSIGDNIFDGCLITTVIYNGIIAQWDALTQNTYWNYNSNVNLVHCTDGDINIEDA